MFTVKGVFVNSLGGRKRGMYGPVDVALAMDSDPGVATGRMLIVNQLGHCVTAATEHGFLEAVCGERGPAQGQFLDLTGVVVLSDGTMIVREFTQRLQVFRHVGLRVLWLKSVVLLQQARSLAH